MTCIRDGTDWRVFVSLHHKRWTGIAEDMLMKHIKSIDGSDYTIWRDTEHYNSKSSFKRHYDIVGPDADCYTKMYRQA